MNPRKRINNKLIVKIQSIILVALLAALLGLMGWLVGGNQMAVIIIGSLLMIYVFSPRISPAFLLKFKSGRQLTPHSAPQLFEILRELSHRAELTRLPKLVYLPTDEMLALTLGLRDNAVVAISSGLLRKLSRSELTAVLAHEISHIRHSDVHIMAFAALAGQFLRLLSVFGQIMLLISIPMILVGQLVVIWPAIFLLIFSPTLSNLIHLALSRTREYNADISATELTRDPQALASALAKMDNAQKRLFRKMYWPIIPKIPQNSWLRTHPPTKKRIQRLLETHASNQLNQDYTYNFGRNHYQIPVNIA